MRPYISSHSYFYLYFYPAPPRTPVIFSPRYLYCLISLLPPALPPPPTPPQDDSSAPPVIVRNARSAWGGVPERQGSFVDDGPGRLGLSARARLLANLKAGRAHQPLGIISRYMRVWRGQARDVRVARAKIQFVLGHMRLLTPEMRLMRAGMSAFISRSPSWVVPPPRSSQSPISTVRLDEDAFWARSMRHRHREAVHGTPTLTQGTFRFGVRVSGLHQGMVVGVCDATDPAVSGPNDARAWGLHLTHGALFTKRQLSSKGVLSTRQLVHLDAYAGVVAGGGGGAAAREVAQQDGGAAAESPMVEIEIEVDMDRRKIAFGLPGTTLIEAPVTLSKSVRPWAYLWNAGDAVMIDSRTQGMRSARMRTGHYGTAAGAAPKLNGGGAPLPLRARAQWISDPLTGEPLYYLGAGTGYESPRRAAFGSPRAFHNSEANSYVARVAMTGEYLPEYLRSPESVSYNAIGQHPSGYAPSPRPSGCMTGSLGATPGSGRYSPGSPLSRRLMFGGSRPAHRSDWHSAAAAMVVDSPADSPAVGTSALVEEGYKSPLQSAMQEEAATIDDPSEAMGMEVHAPQGSEDGDTVAGSVSRPSRARSPNNVRSASRGAAHSPGRTGNEYGGTQYALSMRTAPLSPRTSRGRSITHMWDMVRYVTGVYSDVYKQI